MPDNLPQPTPAVPRLPDRPPGTHKGKVGSVAIVAGSRGMSGAAVLSGFGALRGGAGLVRVFCAESVLPIVAMSDPCLMTAPIKESPEGLLTHDSLMSTFDFDWASVLAIGPGLGRDPQLLRLVSDLLTKFEGPAVVDADALNNLASDPDLPWEKSHAKRVWDARADRPTIITPHPGEMGRLRAAAHLEEMKGQDDETRKPVAHQYADRSGVTVVLKGRRTVVATRDALYINTSGNPGMATGGMGDVLTGFLGALLGQGMPAFDAARLGVYAHGLAADLCAQQIAPVGYLAREVADHIPAALAEASRPRIGFR